MYDVIIVGGGASGLVAAKLLAEKKLEVLLLEAKESLGGRIQKINFSNFNAEAGAEFIHGNLQTTFNLLKQAGLQKKKITGNFCRVTNGKWSMDENFIEHWELLTQKLKTLNNDLTVDDFMKKYFHQKKYAKLTEQYKKYVQGYDAADTKHASALAILKEMKNENEDQYKPVPAYNALIQFLYEKCFEHNAVIKTNEAVTQIKRDENIEVVTASRNMYQCKKIIVAVPVGVLQCNKTNKSFIQFPSSINHYISAAKKIGNGGVIKFLIEFDKAFWLAKKFLKEKNIQPPSYIFTDAVIPTWWTQYPSKVPLLTGWLAGPSSFKMKNYSEKKFKQLILQSLSSIFNMPVEMLESKLVNYKIMNWNVEPHVLGGYSYHKLKTENALALLRKPFEKEFYFAGEYLAKNSSSTVDDALQSGIEVAEKILNEMN